MIPFYDLKNYLEAPVIIVVDMFKIRSMLRPIEFLDFRWVDENMYVWI